MTVVSGRIVFNVSPSPKIHLYFTAPKLLFRKLIASLGTVGWGEYVNDEVEVGFTVMAKNELSVLLQVALSVTINLTV